MRKHRNVFETILQYGHDESFCAGRERTILPRPMLRPDRGPKSICWRSAFRWVCRYGIRKTAAITAA